METADVRGDVRGEDYQCNTEAPPEYLGVSRGDRPEHGNQSDGTDKGDRCRQGKTYAYLAAIAEVVGKTLDRLIAHYQAKEKNSLECLEWYKRELEHNRSELSELLQIREVLTQLGDLPED